MSSRYSLLAALIAVCASAVGHVAPAVAQMPHTHNHSFADAKQWSQYFDDPKRDEWQKPHDVISALDLKPNAAVADIGAGTGYFSVRLAHMVPEGRIYAVDTEPHMVKYLADRAKRDGIKNITAVQAKPGNAELPKKVDVVLMVDVYHHIDNRTDYFKTLAASLKPGARIAIIDYRMDSPEGPPKPARVPPERMEAEMKRAGYELVKQYDFLPKQQFLVFQHAKG